MATKTAKVIVVGISGASSSGKTTISRLIRDIFPNTFVFHEDDFYKLEKELPTKHGLLDWDCAGALDIPAMASTLAHVQETGAFPTTFDSKEDRNDIGPCPVSDFTITQLRNKVAVWHSDHPILRKRRLCIFDGFLLYAPSMAEVQSHIDIKFFLQVSYAKAKARREARSGYATIEGFWEDPPGYVDKIVWPNYVADHAHLFEAGNVEGKMIGDVKENEGIQMYQSSADGSGGGCDVDMGVLVEWMVDRLMVLLEGMETEADKIVDPPIYKFLSPKTQGIMRTQRRLQEEAKTDQSHVSEDGKHE